MRKLASVQYVHDVTPIIGADKIELVHILGWQCVANKGQFKTGDKAVYFEIDSFLPVRPEFEFLRSSSCKENEILGSGFRLRTMKFRGQISQGLVLPLKELNVPESVDVGTDVTEYLGVRKWEIEERATTGGTVIGSLPYTVPYTNETRIQEMPELINEFGGKMYYITIKMDGSSHSISIDENGFHVTGHNYEYKDDDSSDFYKLVKARGYKLAMEKYMTAEGIKTMTIQGEFCGPGIQKNKLKLSKPEWYVFTIIVDGKRVGLTDLLLITDGLGMEHVPVEEAGVDLPKRYPTVEALLERAEGEYPNGGPREGIVIRPIEPEYCELIRAPLSMKVINNKYLLKKG